LLGQWCHLVVVVGWDGIDPLVDAINPLVFLQSLLTLPRA